MSLNKKQVEYIAFHDSLSELPNRAYIRENLQQIVETMRKNNFGALVFIDVDNFKNVNDTLGHNVGDELILKVVYLLKESLKDQDILCHMSIDKFLIINRSSNDELEIAGRVYDLMKKLKNNFDIEEYNIYVTASMGVAMYPKDGVNSDKLLRNADIAINFAKNSGKNTYKFFTEEMKIKVAEEVALQKELRQAVQREEFRVFYQPKINISTGEMEGMEALVRWLHPTKGIIPPYKFIPLAEENGIITKIGEYVMRTACMQNKIWQDKGYKPLRVAINLSVKQLTNNGIVNSIKKVLRDTDLDPKWIEFEITESMVMKDFKHSQNILNKIRELGIKISLDDFGTGYSSLNCLKSLPINNIKIDKSFIDEIVTDKKQSFIVSAIINLAHGIDLKVIAEGVESKEQFNMLEEYNCDEIQGYIFSKPVNREEFEKILNNNVKFLI